MALHRYHGWVYRALGMRAPILGLEAARLLSLHLCLTWPCPVYSHFVEACWQRLEELNFTNQLISDPRPYVFLITERAPRGHGKRLLDPYIYARLIPNSLIAHVIYPAEKT
ncbi:uncharacterized protein BDV17DRAFT_212133 [Aspergillus undulatus]|uniref:uncharacterized protein n=1 Tax=Aspergillus undulatus TaxID=1810928 RepID=UPI003CCDFD42